MEENREKNIVIGRKRKRKRRNTTTDDNNNDVKRWSDLPNELLESIKKRLFYADQQNLHAVCKSWSSIEQEEERLHPPPLQQMPWLLVLDGADSCRLVDSIYKKTYKVDMKSITKKMKIDSCNRMQCHESKYGWLLISSIDRNPDSTTLFLFSPFLDENNNCIELPILSFDICLATFTSNPLDLDDVCTVVTLNTSFQTDAIVINTYRLERHSSWNSLVFQCDQFSLSDVKSWMYTDDDEGVFYYVIRDGRVGTFHLAREEWNVFPPLPATMQTTSQTLLRCVKVYMVKSDGELFLISERNLSATNSQWSYDVQYIYRLDLSSMIWEDLNSIGDRVLFIGDGYRSVLNSSVLKSNGEQKGISDTIYYCLRAELKYCSVHDYTVRNSDKGFPRRHHCDRHYGSISRDAFAKVLIDPPPFQH